MDPKTRAKQDINFLINVKSSISVGLTNFILVTTDDFIYYGKKCLIIPHEIEENVSLIYICKYNNPWQMTREMMFFGIYKDDKLYFDDVSAFHAFDDTDNTLATYNIFPLSAELTKLENQIKEMYTEKVKYQDVEPTEPLTLYEKKTLRFMVLRGETLSLAEMLMETLKFEDIDDILKQIFCGLITAEDYVSSLILLKEEAINRIHELYVSEKTYIECELVIQDWEKELYQTMRALDQKSTVLVTLSHLDTTVDTKLKVSTIFKKVALDEPTLSWVGDFSSSKEGKRVMEIFTNAYPDYPLSIADISKISYRKKVLYERDTNNE
jgi:hypothetical protein